MQPSIGVKNTKTLLSVQKDSKNSLLSRKETIPKLSFQEERKVSIYNNYKIITLSVRYQKKLLESSNGNHSICAERLSFPSFFQMKENMYDYAK